MKFALHKEILYLDNEIESLETLRDVNNKKVKYIKSYYINNKEILLNYFNNNNYNKRYVTNLDKKNISKDLTDNCFVDIGKGKCYLLKLNNKIYKFYSADEIVGNSIIKHLDKNDFIRCCDKLNEMKVGLSLSRYAYNKMMECWPVLNSVITDETLSEALRNSYHGGYFLNPIPLKIYKGMFWDYDYNAAYLSVLEETSDISGLFYVANSINEVPNESRWIAHVEINRGKCTSKYPYLTSMGHVYDFSKQRYVGILSNDEINTILKHYKDVEIKYIKIWYSLKKNRSKLGSFANEVEELRQSNFKPFRSIAKAIYTHGIGNLASRYRKVSQSNIYYQIVLGSVRSKLYETVNYVSSHGYEVYYIDTDGFATNCSPDELIKLGFNISEELGDFKIEREGYNFMTTEADCKQYLWLDENGNINHKLSGDPDIVVEKAVNLYKEQLEKINRKEVTHEERISKLINRLNSYICNVFNWWYRCTNKDIRYNDCT